MRHGSLPSTSQLPVRTLRGRESTEGRDRRQGLGDRSVHIVEGHGLSLPTREHTGALQRGPADTCRDGALLSPPGAPARTAPWSCAPLAPVTGLDPLGVDAPPTAVVAGPPRAPLARRLRSPGRSPTARCPTSTG